MFYKILIDSKIQILFKSFVLFPLICILLLLVENTFELMKKMNGDGE